MSETDDDEGADIDEVPTAEKVVMIVSIGFTLSLFTFAAWHAVVDSPRNHPSATVTALGETVQNGSLYEVRVQNDDDVGLVSVTVAISCGDPPRQLTFENVPAQGEATGTVVCPRDASPPSATVVQWIRQ